MIGGHVRVIFAFFRPKLEENEEDEEVNFAHAGSHIVYLAMSHIRNVSHVVFSIAWPNYRVSTGQGQKTCFIVQGPPVCVCCSS